MPIGVVGVGSLVQTGVDHRDKPAQKIAAVLGESGQASFEARDGDCVFTLTFTFASGTKLNRPDTDLCQADGIVVE